MPVIPLPGALFILEFIGVLLHRAVIKKYNFCFIPDLPGELNVSGRLSHGIKLPHNARFIGILSRFTDIRSTENDNPASFRHNTVILSGPEPQRGILKQKLADILKTKETPTIFLEGKPDKTEKTETRDNILFYNHLPAAGMKELIKNSESIITRSGYTTVMELLSLNCSALIIPTPGQTEQEYLARYLEEKGWFTSIAQKNINSGMIFPSINPGWKNEILEQSKSLLEKALIELSEKEKE
jgi:spore coat polysaccharide biosynthesis predicted glycosyltransferase SpsG